MTVGDDDYLKWLTCYIHQNPKVAGLIKKLEDYKWSSYLEFLGKDNGSMCDKEIILNQFKNIKEFENFTEDSYEAMKNKTEFAGLVFD